MAIDRISPHCVVGQCTAEGLGDWFAKASTQASSNYGIDRNGRIGLYVEEKNRSWCTSSGANDNRAVTIECASDSSEPYAFRDEVYQTLIKLCADICRRNGKSRLLWLGDKDRTLAYTPASDEMVLTVHRWFANKSCPGSWLMARMDDLAAKVTAALGSKVEPSTDPVLDPIPAVSETDIERGAVVEINSSATQYYPDGPYIPAWVKEDYIHVVTQVTVAGKPYFRGGKQCVLLGKKIMKNGGVVQSGINTWVALDNLFLHDDAVQDPEPEQVSPAVSIVHTVARGDSLWAIATKYLGNGARYGEIKSLNGLSSNVIHPGQKLKIPS